MSNSVERVRGTIRGAVGLALLLSLASPSPVPADPGFGAWEGRYALDLRLASVTRVPVVGSERSVTRTLLLVEMARGERGWVQRQRVCGVTIRSERMRMTVPDAFVASFPPRTYTGVVQGPGDVARYRVDLGPEHIGYDPALTGGELPRDAAAPGVLDSDGDGRPGATVVGHFPLFGRVRLYIAQRSHLVLVGRQTALDRIEGQVDVRLLEQRTLGASNSLFRRTLPTRPDPEHSGFTMTRTEARSCEELGEG